MKQRIILLLLITLNTFSVLAQDQTKHEILISAAGGASALSYTPNIGDTKNKTNYCLGISYFHNLNRLWSVGTGLEISSYNASYNLNTFSDSYIANDGTQDFEFLTNGSNYHEKQSGTYLKIPIIGRISIPIFKDVQLYSSAGIKIGIPIKSDYEVRALLHNSGHYSYPENVIYDSQEFMGFGFFNYKQSRQSLNLKPLLIGTIETGLRFKLNTNLSLLTGVYYEQSLSDLRKDNSDKHLIEFNNKSPKNFSINGVLSSQYKIDQQYHPITKNLRAKSLGVRIGLSIKI